MLRNSIPWQCWNEYAFLSYEGAAKGYYDNPNALLPFPSDINETSPSFLKVPEETHKCSDFINLPPVKPTQVKRMPMNTK